MHDDKNEPRTYDLRAGFSEFASRTIVAIEESIVKRFINRYRLVKKNPEAKVSEPLEPIIYYVDRGAPEPIKSALIEGASWWNQAFEVAGYKNVFIVKKCRKEQICWMFNTT